MIFTLTVFRVELAELAVDLGPLAKLLQGSPQEALSPVEVVVDGMSDWWVRKMLKRRRR